MKGKAVEQYMKHWMPDTEETFETEKGRNGRNNRKKY